MEQHIIAGIDLGNGYVKSNMAHNGASAAIDAKPSLAAKQFNTTGNLPLANDEIDAFMLNIWNEMDLSFSSPLVSAMDRRLFGERAIKSGLTLEEFDVYNNVSKAQVDLSGVLALATLASKALVKYYEGSRALPTETIPLTVDLAVALPIREYAQHASTYREKFTNGGAQHIVTFHNFTVPVRVAITVTNIMVVNEGEAAQYGLYFANEKFQKVIETDSRKRYPGGELDEATGLDLVQAKNTLGIDIGEGTIDFPVFTNGKFNADSSSTLNEGYGTVLETTLGELKQQNHPYKSRKELAEFLNQTPGKFARKKHEHVKNTNHEQERRFAAVVGSEVTKVFNKVGSFTEVVFVYGGGATPLSHVLFDELKRVIAGFGDDNFVPVVYLESDYSRFLNAQGMFQVAKRLAERSQRTTV